MRNHSIFWIIVAAMLILDIYVFQAVRTVLPADSPRLRVTITVIYWLIAVVGMGLLIAIPYMDYESWPRALRTYLFSMVVAIFFSKLIASVFIAMDDIRRAGTWVLTRLFSNPSLEISRSPGGITRSVFMSWLGLAMGGTLFSTLIYGFTNKYNYQLNRVRLSFKNLPQGFRGLKIVQVSDIHSGSFMDKQAVMKGVDNIMKEKADLILFTGDLVNDRASEMESYMDVFGKLRAPLGVYSILGNHDYGDYVRWESAKHKADNLERLKQVHAELGWRLLLNEHVTLEHNGDRIGLLGVENWSAKGNFGKYGDLGAASSGTENLPFKILMSHDPSHWEGEVLEKHTDIDLVLAGHTHGMQFGVEVPGFRWSPVQYMYKQWAGLYTSGEQKLYVNRGFGFIGYPGRVGILPEITVLTLA